MNLKNLLSCQSLSWAFYDFANTVFSALVVTVYLPLYFTSLTGENTPLGIAATVSMIISGFVIPPLGALTDRTGKTKSYLLISTGLCVLMTCSLSFTQSSSAILTLFIGANLLYHSSLVFYNSMLPLVAPPEHQGWVSGLGTGLGYLGILFALPLAHGVDTRYGTRWVFLLAGILFLIFSLPLFLSVPERRVKNPLKFGLQKSLSSLLQNKPFLFLLLGNFFVLDVLNAFILWLSVFLKRTFLLPQSTLIETILLLNISAFFFSILLGKLTDQIGYKKVLLVSTTFLAIVIVAVGSIVSFDGVRFFIIFLGGASAAGIWTAARKAVAAFSPPERIGEFFGLYGFTTKISAIGSTTIPFLADLFGFRIAVLSQLLPIACACYFISRVPTSKDQ